MTTHRWPIVLVLVIATVMPGRAEARLLRGRLCALNKVKTSGKAVGRMLRCHQIAASLGVPADAACLQTAGNALVATYQRLDARSGDTSDYACLLWGGEDAARADAESIAASLVAMLRPVPDASLCAASKVQAAAQSFTKQARRWAQTDGIGGDWLEEMRAKLEGRLDAFDGKSDCLTTGDATPVAAAVGARAASLHGRILGFCGNDRVRYPDNRVGSAEDCDGTDDAACPGQCAPDCTCP